MLVSSPIKMGGVRLSILNPLVHVEHHPPHPPPQKKKIVQGAYQMSLFKSCTGALLIHSRALFEAHIFKMNSHDMFL